MCSLNVPTITACNADDRLALNEEICEDGLHFLLSAKAITLEQMHKAARMCDAIVTGELLKQSDMADLERFAKVLDPRRVSSRAEYNSEVETMKKLHASIDYTGLLKGVIAKALLQIQEKSQK